MILLWNSVLKRTWIEYYQGIKCVYRSKPNEWCYNLINQRFGLNKFNIFNEFIFTLILLKVKVKKKVNELKVNMFNLIFLFGVHKLVWFN